MRKMRKGKIKDLTKPEIGKWLFTYLLVEIADEKVINVSERGVLVLQQKRVRCFEHFPDCRSRSCQRGFFLPTDFQSGTNFSN